VVRQQKSRMTFFKLSQTADNPGSDKKVAQTAATNVLTIRRNFERTVKWMCFHLGPESKIYTTNVLLLYHRLLCITVLHHSGSLHRLFRAKPFDIKCAIVAKIIRLVEHSLSLSLFLCGVVLHALIRPLLLLRAHRDVFG